MDNILWAQITFLGVGIACAGVAQAPAVVSLEGVRTMLAGSSSGAKAAAAAGSTASADPTRDGIEFVRAEDNRVLASYHVNVTNASPDVDADDVVLGFIKPPGAGESGVALQTLFAFERVHVRAGETVQVYLAAHNMDFTAARGDGSRAALAGGYTVQFGVAGGQGMGLALTRTVAA
jgi:pre-mRNA-splicing factor SYF2/beta-D-xylosidase 4